MATFDERATELIDRFVDLKGDKELAEQYKRLSQEYQARDMGENILRVLVDLATMHVEDAKTLANTLADDPLAYCKRHKNNVDSVTNCIYRAFDGAYEKIAKLSKKVDMVKAYAVEKEQDFKEKIKKLESEAGGLDRIIEAIRNFDPGPLPKVSRSRIERLKKL